jgi:uncharacterized membrane protein YgcG
VKERDEMMNPVDALDDVLARVAAGESLASSVARYASRDLAAELTALIGARDRLSVLAPAPALSADVLAARRRQFLSTARAYKRQTTSATLLQRFTAWAWPARRQGQSALLPATWVARVAIALVLVLSIVGGTAAAAQSSLPDSPLYGIKLAVEGARLNFARAPSQQAMLSLSFAGERVREIERQAIANRPISGQVSLRLQNELDAALSAAARAPEPEMLRLLNQIRTMAQTQERALAQAEVSAPSESGKNALRQAEQAMTQAQRQAEAGLADPGTFRNQYGQSAPVQLTPEATAIPQPLTPTTVAQPTAMPEATATSKHIQAGTEQPPTSAPEPQATGTPPQTGPGPQPTASQGAQGPQATDAPEGYPGGKSGGGSSSGGSSGSDGGTGGNNGGGTRRP